MTVSVFANTNLFVYAESEEQDKTSRAIAIIQNFRVISTQVINEAVSVPIRMHGFLLSEAHEIAESLLVFMRSGCGKCTYRRPQGH